jgi:hypothetical protein
VFRMSETIRILTVERDADDGLIVTFSDGTTAGYLSDELLELRPQRDRAIPKIQTGARPVWCPPPSCTELVN